MTHYVQIIKDKQRREVHRDVWALFYQDFLLVKLDFEKIKGNPFVFYIAGSSKLSPFRWRAWINDTAYLKQIIFFSFQGNITVENSI